VHTALLWEMTCKIRHLMSLRHSVVCTLFVFMSSAYLIADYRIYILMNSVHRLCSLRYVKRYS